MGDQGEHLMDFCLTWKIGAWASQAASVKFVAGAARFALLAV